MKKFLSKLLLLTALLASGQIMADSYPLGIDKTTGQQKTAKNVTIPDTVVGDLVLTTTAQTISGAKTFTTGTHIFSGADTLRIPTTVPSLTNGNIGNNGGVLTVGDGTAARAYTTLATAQSISGAKTFANNTLLLGGAGAGVATLTNANTANSRAWTIPDTGGADTVMGLSGAQTVTGAKTFSGANTLIIPTTVPGTTNGSIGNNAGILTVGDGSAAQAYDALAVAQTISATKTFTADQKWNSGNDALFYSDAGSTIKAAIFADGAPAVVSNTNVGFNTNCEFAVSGTTFTLSGFGGTALSATNPCIVVVRQTTGKAKPVYFTANVTFTFGATSDTDGNDWGLTNTVNWANNMPFFIGVVYDDTTPFFTISRLPLPKTGSAATAVCQKGDVDCDGGQDVMILTTGLTLANWVGKPITQVGWILASYATTGGAWTFATDLTTGFNQLYASTEFTFPLGQNGASAGTFFLPNGGTAPVETTNNFEYKIHPDGNVDIDYFLDQDGGADGVGAVDSKVAIPYAYISNTNAASIYLMCGRVQGQTTILNASTATCALTDQTANIVQINYISGTPGLANVQNGMFTAGARNFSGRFSYDAMGRIL